MVGELIEEGAGDEAIFREVGGVSLCVERQLPREEYPEVGRDEEPGEDGKALGLVVVFVREEEEHDRDRLSLPWPNPVGCCSSGRSGGLPQLAAPQLKGEVGEGDEEELEGDEAHEPLEAGVGKAVGV